ncbi:MAG TPA: type II secretion system protein [Gemmatimonadota bacterium]|nr:type II secretion system protein [Gemmatimonadota bacterium]
MRGYTIAEVLLALGIMAVLVSVAVPALARSRARVNVAAARDAFAATCALAQQAAAQYGRLSRLYLDPDADRFWVTVDTAVRRGTVPVDTVGPLVGLKPSFGGVQLDGARRTICFDPRGFATARGDCDLPNATIVFSRGGIADTVTLSRLGRVSR